MLDLISEKPGGYEPAVALLIAGKVWDFQIGVCGTGPVFTYLLD